MASRYPAVWLEELRARSDIVQVVSGYVSLTKKGRNYWGLCPFHGEKTASFSVDEEHQLYYCFGCKAGGNVINFVMDIDRLTFQEAVERLADREHMTLPEMERDEDYRKRQTMKERLLSANLEAARFYHETLFTPAGAASLDYLRRRGLSDGIIRRFGLGAAPNGWTVLTDHLLAKGWTLQELSQAGLTVLKDAEDGKQRYYDIFRNRAMFPIIDARGNVLAFGGRTLEKKSDRKYLNTSTAYCVVLSSNCSLNSLFVTAQSSPFIRPRPSSPLSSNHNPAHKRTQRPTGWGNDIQKDSTARGHQKTLFAIKQRLALLNIKR